MYNANKRIKRAAKSSDGEPKKKVKKAPKPQKKPGKPGRPKAIAMPLPTGIRKMQKMQKARAKAMLKGREKPYSNYPWTWEHDIEGFRLNKDELPFWAKEPERYMGPKDIYRP